MSSISAGTNSATALVSTGDTTGQLDLQINGGTQAVRINTSGAIGVGTSPAYGSSGQVLTSGGSSAAPTWTTPNTGFSGATTTSSATNITLTSSSTQVQLVTMTATGLSVVLPDATTCTKGGVIFSIINNGTIPFSIIDSNGYAYETLTPSQASSYFLDDNSTSVGKWSTATNKSMFQTITASPLANDQNLVIALTDTSGVVLRTTGSILYSTAYTLSGTTFTWGTETSIYTNPSGSTISISEMVKLTDTTFLVTFSRNYATSRADGMAIACSVSGTTITPGTAVTIQASAGNSQSVNFHFTLRFSSTVLLAIYEYYSSGNYGNYYNPLSISGTTITVGSQGTWTVVGANNYILPMFACKVSSTTALLGWYKPNIGSYGPVVVVMSGSTVSSFTETTTNDFASIYAYSWSPSTDVAYVYSTASTTVYKWTVSGTTVTQNNAGSISPALFQSVPPVGYNAQIVKSTIASPYLLASSTSYSTVYSVTGGTPSATYAPAAANTNTSIKPTCNVVPTSGGALAVLLGDNKTVAIIRGFV